MNASHLGRAVAFICAQRGTTQTVIAANAGVSQVILSRACNGTRPEAKTLRAICTSQPDHRDNIDLLIGHLRDEIERAGHSTHEVEISAADARLDDDLRLLLEEAKHDPQLAGMLRQLAGFVRTHPLADDVEDTAPLQAVAEESEPYGAKATAAIRQAALDEARRQTPPPSPPAAPSPKRAARP